MDSRSGVLGASSQYLKKDKRLSKLVISRVIIRGTPLRALITLPITYLLSPLPLRVETRTTANVVSHRRQV